MRTMDGIKTAIKGCLTILLVTASLLVSGCEGAAGKANASIGSAMPESTGESMVLTEKTEAKESLDLKETAPEETEDPKEADAVNEASDPDGTGTAGATLDPKEAAVDEAAASTADSAAPENKQPEAVSPAAASSHVHEWVTETVVTKAAWDEQILVSEPWTETFVIIHTGKGDVRVKVEGVGAGVVTLDYEWDKEITEVHCYCQCGFDYTEAEKETHQTFDELYEVHAMPALRILSDLFSQISKELYDRGETVDDATISRMANERYEEIYGKPCCGGWHTSGYKRYEHQTTCDFAYYRNSDYEFVQHEAEYKTIRHEAEYSTVTRCRTCNARP